MFILYDLDLNFKIVLVLDLPCSENSECENTEFNIFIGWFPEYCVVGWLPDDWSSSLSW